MIRGRSQDNDPRPDSASPDRPRAAHPVALATIGALSLFVFTAAGWSLGRMRAAGAALPAASVYRRTRRALGLMGRLTS